MFGLYRGPDVITLAHDNWKKCCRFTRQVHDNSARLKVREQKASDQSLSMQAIMFGAEFLVHQMFGTEHPAVIGCWDQDDAWLEMGDYYPVDVKCQHPKAKNTGVISVTWNRRHREAPQHTIYACFSYLGDLRYRLWGWMQQWELRQNEMFHMEPSLRKGNDPRLVLQLDQLHRDNWLLKSPEKTGAASTAP